MGRIRQWLVQVLQPATDDKKKRTPAELKEWKARMDQLRQERKEQKERFEQEKQERAEERARRAQEIDALRYDAMKARYERILLEEEARRDEMLDEDDDQEEQEPRESDPLQTILHGFMEGAANVRRRDSRSKGRDTVDTEAIDIDREAAKAARSSAPGAAEDSIDDELEKSLKGRRSP